MSFSSADLFGLMILGSIVGYASGLFGVGGGFILTPLLVAVFHVPVRIAVGSGLAQMIVTSILVSRKHATAGNVDARFVAISAPGIILGTFLGSNCLRSLDCFGSVQILGRDVLWINLIINGIFAILLAAIALRLLHESATKVGSETLGYFRWDCGPCVISLPASGINSCSIISIVLCGCVVGILAGLLGIGGGVILIPLLVYGYGVSMRVAIGTSSLQIFVSALVGTVVHALAGHVSLPLTVVLVVGSMTGAVIGARQSLRLSVPNLNRFFALLIIGVDVIVIFRILG